MTKHTQYTIYDSLGAVSKLSAELRKSAKARHLTVNLLSTDFAAASKNSIKIFAALKKWTLRQ